MCLLVLAWNAHPRCRLVVAANRDECHERPAAPLAPWPAPDDILGGRDLRAGGTWLAVDRRRRIGAVTNFRDLTPAPPDAPSRGELIADFLRASTDAGEYIAALESQASRYGGFNLLLADERSLWYASNRSKPFARELSPGVYGLSNDRLDTPWPKLRRARRRFEAWLGTEAEDPQELCALLEDPEPASDGQGLPATGLSSEWERTLSSAFVVHPRYGTRCSTVLTLGRTGELRLIERRFDRAGERTGQSEYRILPGRWI